MTINSYDKGDMVRIDGAFTDENDAPVDPQAVLFSSRNPAGTSVTLTYGVDADLVRDATGIYHVDINASLSGMWFYRWHSTGSGQAADEGQFFVKPTLV